MIKWSALLMVLLLSFVGKGQYEAKGDSLVVSFETYLKWVRENHPQLNIAALKLDAARAEVRGLNGMFDPKIKAGFREKTFQDVNYYRGGEVGLEVPVPIGEINADYANSGGTYLNPEQNFPNDGLVKIGYTLPLLQGLWTDERRTALRQREAVLELGDAERQLMLNEVLGDAIRTYLEWNYYYRVRKMYDEILVLSRRRHEQVKTSFFSGDIMEMDTVESFTRVQFWEQAALEADLGYYKKTQEVNQFLWTDDGKPLVLEQRAHPVDEWPEQIFVNLRDSVMQISENDQLREHPKLRSIEWGIAILRTEEQYAKELLKPKLDVNYNLLMGQPSTAYNLTPLDENYVFGVSFEFPLFLRQERSKLQLTRLKIQESQYKMDNTRWTLITKMRQGLFALDNLEERLVLQRAQAENFRRLYDGELIQWQEGFSTQFVLNTREQRFLKAALEREQLALAKLVAELNLALAVAVFY